MERCPVCRAALNGATTCRRCRADLREVQQAAALAAELAGAAMRCLAEGRMAEAARLLDRARLLHATPDILALWRRLPRRPAADDGALFDPALGEDLQGLGDPGDGQGQVGAAEVDGGAGHVGA